MRSSQRRGRELGFRFFGLEEELSRRSDCSQEPDACRNSVVEIGKMELLVRRVHAVVREGKAHEDRRNTEAALEHINHGNGTTRPQEDGCGAKTLFIRKRRGPHCGVPTARQRWFGGRHSSHP